EVAWQEMKSAMALMHDACKEKDIPFCVVIYPYSSQVATESSERVPQNDLLEFWASKGVPAIDVTDLYKNQDQEMFVGASHLHLSPYGHKVVSAAISDLILNNFDLLIEKP
ncbi:MAG: hypothetical protein WBD31_18205, partial [Rubripirellula sp.]